MTAVSSLLAESLVFVTLAAVQVQEKRLEELAATTISVTRGSIHSVAVAPDGKSIAYAYHAGVAVVSFPEGKVLHNIEEDQATRSRLVSFTPDGKRLIGAFPGLRVWDLETGKRLIAEKWEWERTGYKTPIDERIPRPAVSPDGKRLYVGGSSDDFRVIEVETGKELKHVRFLGKPPTCFAPSPDGKLVAVTTANALILLRTDTFAERDHVALPQPKVLHRYAVRFPAGSTHLFVMGPSGVDDSPEIRIWDCEKNRFTLSFPPVRRNMSFDPSEATVTVVGDGRYALVCPNEVKAFGIYDLKEEKYLGWTGTKQGGVAPLVPTPDGKHLIGGRLSDELVVIKVEDVLKLIIPTRPEKQP